MLTASVPFESCTDYEDTYNAQMSGAWKFPSSIPLSKEVKQLIELMLEPDPAKRIDPFGIWMHEWIQKCYVKNVGWNAGPNAKATKSPANLFKWC